MLNGYVVYKKKISYEEQQYAISCMNDKVDYTKLKTFIDNYFLPKLPFKDPVYVKARFSNNNNSTDAAVLHSDVYNYTNEPEIPLYTALCYFDKAQLELIPRSHTKPKDSFLTENARKIIIEVEPGDVVVFNSVLTHRGVNYSKGQNRRLLQVFEIFPSQELYKENIHKLLTVDTSNGSGKNLLYYIAQIKWLIDIVNFIVFWLHYNNLKYKVIGKELPPWQKKDRYVSYEPGNRIKYIDGLVDDQNINIIFNDSEIVKYSNFYLWIFIFIFIIIGLFILKKFI